jgi:hypothetical protein
MTDQEARFILFKASAAYPHIEIANETITVWVERLANIPFEQGVRNLNRHIDTSRYFPVIADIINHDPHQFTDYSQLRNEHNERIAELESWEPQAIACPEHLIPKMLKRGADHD